MFTLESIFDSLLNDDNISVFGTLMIADIIDYLGKLEIGFKDLMPGTNKDAVPIVVKTIINSYANVRGKDFARKLNAWKGVSHTETTCTTLGTIDYIISLKK